MAEILGSGHDNVDVQTGHVPRTFRPKNRDLLADAGLAVLDEWEMDVLPGVPLCGSCGDALSFSSEGGVIVAACRPCGRRERYHRAEASLYAGLACVMGHEHRVEPAARKVAGATALACPSCGGPLPASIEPVVACGYCGTASRLPIEARAQAVDAAPVWVCFQGESSVRREYQAALAAAAAQPPPQALPLPAGDEHRFGKLFVVGVVVVMLVALTLGVLSRL